MRRELESRPTNSSVSFCANAKTSSSSASVLERLFPLPFHKACAWGRNKAKKSTATVWFTETRACLLEEVVARRDAIAKVVALTSMTQYGEGLYARPSDGRTLRVGIRVAVRVCQTKGEGSSKPLQDPRGKMGPPGGSSYPTSHTPADFFYPLQPEL